MIRLLHVFALALTLLAGASVGYSQDLGDLNDLDPNLGGGVDNGNVVDNGNFGNQGGGGGGNLPGDGGDFLEGVGEMIADERAQGFVGPTASAIESGDTGDIGGSPGFIGPTKDRIEATSGGAEIQREGGSAGQGSAAGETNGVFISRSSVRTRVVPNFSFDPIPNAVISRGFEQRLRRLPMDGRGSASQGVRVQIEGTTALISGVAANQQAIDDMLGQLRMEPGVYRIINDVRISGAQNQNESPLGFSSSNN